MPPKPTLDIDMAEFRHMRNLMIKVQDKAKEIIGIESIKDAVVNANQNAALNGCEHVSFLCDDAANKLTYLSKKRSIDVLVVDPPRSGLDDGNSFPYICQNQSIFFPESYV